MISQKRKTDPSLGKRSRNRIVGMLGKVSTLFWSPVLVWRWRRILVPSAVNGIGKEPLFRHSDAKYVKKYRDLYKKYEEDMSFSRTFLFATFSFNPVGASGLFADRHRRFSISSSWLERQFMEGAKEYYTALLASGTCNKLEEESVTELLEVLNSEGR